jgi:hypothetical protein
VDRPSYDHPGETATGARLFGEDLGVRIDRWAADVRVDEAARMRARERWLRHQAEAEGSLRGVLADIAERAMPVTVHVKGGLKHRGEIGAVGSDFVTLRSAGTDVIVAIAAVTSVRTRAGEPSTIGDRSITTSLRLVDVLADLAAERAAVLLVTGGGEDTVAGELRSVGRDVVGVRVADAATGTAYLPVRAIVEVVLGG